MTASYGEQEYSYPANIAHSSATGASQWSPRNCPHKMFMVVTDAHSKWPEIIEVSDTTSSKTIQELKKLFAAYGLPQQVATDNGPQFTSTEFSYFRKCNGIKYIRCSPYHLSSNGESEHVVQTFKRSLKVAVQQGESVSQRLCDLTEIRHIQQLTRDTKHLVFKATT